LKIVCSSNVQYGREAFSSLGKTVVLDDRAITPEQLRDCDILAIRSTLKVNRALIENSSVKFIGTATIAVITWIYLSLITRHKMVFCARL